MQHDELMLKIENVSKIYRLGEIGGTTLRDELQRTWAKIRHKEDPTKKIGAKNYNKGEKFKALDDISFEVKKGERIGIIGHNGAGKSTLLKLISRVTGPSKGKIYLNGRVASMLEVGTGFHPELTGRENVYMNGAILGMTKKEIDAKMEDIIEFSEVRQFIDTPVKRYSSGMYVKLAFSVAAHLDSEIMIMDEVLAVGDIQFQQKCINKMKSVSEQEDRTILYVSHNMNTIRQLCDRVIVLEHGRLIFMGGVEEGINLYSLNNNALQKRVEFNQKRNSAYSLSGVFSFKFFELLNNSESIATKEKNINFVLKYSSSKEISNMFFRIVMFFANGPAVGMTYTRKPVDIKKTSIGSLMFNLDLSCLASGLYTLKIYAYGTDSQEGSGYYDVIDENLVFIKIEKDNELDGITWNHARWGHIEFNELSVLKEEE